MFIMNCNSLFLDIVPPGATWKSALPKVNIGFVFPGHTALFYRFISIIWQAICLEVWDFVETVTRIIIMFVSRRWIYNMAFFKTSIQHNLNKLKTE